ncbi:hypothetical protein HG535_0G03010 [Zygotorulaspora mrakii]|uniref:Uncharacterized protein n=1 Tax=Zygotorulaspora mrakii TaxID=42260 RepID=A0A7H9B6R7_ZYGMR|nr:uncharacterized protein HG535_0G03010 [Zygotorulaspora mrakii]QLG74418.1 hypothetical protein HG535_0G03010 [Zygotorulaspora mrakii]
MRKKPPYPVTDLDDIKISGKNVAKWADQEHDETNKGRFERSFVEVIESKSVYEKSNMCRSNHVPNFSSSHELSYAEQKNKKHQEVLFQRHQHIKKKLMAEPEDHTVKQWIKTAEFALQRFLISIDNIIDRTQVPFLLYHKREIEVLLILILTWHIIMIADRCGQFIKDICDIG